MRQNLNSVLKKRGDGGGDLAVGQAPQSPRNIAEAKLFGMEQL